MRLMGVKKTCAHIRYVWSRTAWETGAGLAQEWRVQSVDYRALPEGTFGLPKSISPYR